MNAFLSYFPTFLDEPQACHLKRQKKKRSELFRWKNIGEKNSIKKRTKRALLNHNTTTKVTLLNKEIEGAMPIFANEKAN